ncbi:Ldh family oxidoreductase [Pseudonocardia kunmingensis]|uniref:LDH2 family malate/lactate/ureidoglycolate dehydrogenase n=1 Tax=Pseudonocardia kunmingensis TaxID=630975 RepID=A0A543DRE6_9PSEU|nr:Ldh family oxidoreductase [Pseudonocardia kunmingensis]TQM11874.1 LDH2 family malate/lactate/ureidoglycolate dehydrogenase [Pseudonocardia kunmingensis]
MSAPPPAGTRRVAAVDVHRQISEILRSWGLDEDAAAVTAEAMTHTDLSGIDSHGISMFVSYERLFHSGHLNPRARPTVLRESPVTALVDAQHGFGHPAAAEAMRIAIDKATRAGLGAVSVVNSHHFGAAGFYAAKAAAAGLLGLVTTSARTTAVVPTGGAEPRLSTNPLAFAAPARRHEPFLLDMATSTVAINKIKVYDLADRPLPQGWFVDPAGEPVTDAGTALRAAWEGLGGGLTPLGGPGTTGGGHKGYGLSLMVEILSSALSGGTASATREQGSPDNIGHFCLAIDPGAFRDAGDVLDSVDQIIDAQHATRTADGAEVLVAGEPESRARAERAAHGIPLPASLRTRLREICARTGAPYVLPEG